MPRFAANLTVMFSERTFLERFEAAAGAGFQAVELLFPINCEHRLRGRTADGLGWLRRA